jgi:alpha-glucosidase
LPELVKGEFEFVTHTQDVVAFWRRYQGRAVLCAFNLSGETRELPLPEGAYDDITAPFHATVAGGMLTLPAYQAWFGAQNR